MSERSLPSAAPGGATVAVGAGGFGLAPARRWGVAAGLLGIEYLALSVTVDLPASGPAMQLVRMLRLLVPVVLASAVGSVLLAHRRDSVPAGAPPPAPALPPWRPLPALALHGLAFVATAVVTQRLLGERAAPATDGALLAWLACVVAVVLLAVRIAAPLPWVLRLVVGRWRFPLLAVAFGLMAWRGALEAEGLWGALSEGTLRAVAGLLRLAGRDVAVGLAERAIAVDGFEVEIAPVCSGADGVGLVLVFQGLWIALGRGRLRFPRALVLLPLGAVAAAAANVLRIGALVLVGASGREALALGGFHSRLGWVLFTVIALGTIAVAERVVWFRSAPAAGAAAAGVPAAAAAYVAPLLGAVATALATGVWSDGVVDRAYAARLAVAVAALVLVRRSLPRGSIAWSWPPVLLAGGVAAL